MARKSSTKTYRTLVIEGTRGPLSALVDVESATDSKAGANEFSFSDACLEHNKVLKSPKTCSVCGPGVEVVKKGKAFHIAGDEYLFFTKAEVDTKKPRRSDTLRVIKVFPMSALGGRFDLSADATALLPGVDWLQPHPDDKAQRTLYAVITKLLGKNRVGFVEVVDRRFRYALIRVTDEGRIAMHEVYKQKNVLAREPLDLPALSKEQEAAADAKGAELAPEGAAFDFALTNDDPYAAEVHKLILSRDEGAPMEAEPMPVAFTKEKTVDVLAML